jgi:hypothetical protein
MGDDENAAGRRLGGAYVKRLRMHDTFLEQAAQLPGTSCWRASVRASIASRDDTNGQSC